MSDTFQLLLENGSDYETIFHAIGDSGIRGPHMGQPGMRSGIEEILAMIDYPAYVALAIDVKTKYELWQNNLIKPGL